MPSAAAIYARISSDQDGTGLGVGRQVEDCHRLAAELGWPVAAQYVDNDVSAYGVKKRPQYRRMLADLASRDVDAILIYHPDRLTRRPLELEQFLEILSAAKVRDVRFVSSGGLDIGNGDGLMMLRVLAAVAANESATKSRRVRRKLDQRAEAGLPHGGYLRPFGYEVDKVTIREDEATVIRSLAQRFLAGESLRSLASWLDTQGIRIVAGGPWRTAVLSDLLASARIAGLRVHRGEVCGPAAWQPIISQRDRDRVLARIADRRVSGRRTPRRYLLSGLLRCGKCGHTLYSSPRKATRRYVCLSGPDHGGCSRLTVVAAPLEELVTETVQDLRGASPRPHCSSNWRRSRSPAQARPPRLGALVGDRWRVTHLGQQLQESVVPRGRTGRVPAQSRQQSQFR
jgi:site-specific DNA recombinase